MTQITKRNKEDIIIQTLNQIEYGTLALCDKTLKPYSVPVNFVLIDKSIYFHGGKKGRKIDLIKSNQYASFNAVKPFSIIPSFFSSKNGLACPASHFFKSVIIDGIIKKIDNYEEKTLALSKLMLKLQPEGKYRELDAKSYKNAINATEIYKLIPTDINLKIKLGQHLNDERFDMVIRHLKKRNNPLDSQIIEKMIKQRNINPK